MKVLSFLAWPLPVLLGILAVLALKGPDPVPASAPAIEFSSERALAKLRDFATRPHALGSAEDARVRGYLVQQLAALGLNPQVFSAVGARSYGEHAVIGNAQDVLGRLPGTANSRAIMLMAHYDSVHTAPGAADDGSGVAAILESVRALRSGPALKNDLIVLFTDGEEDGLLGADAFAAAHPWLKDVGLILNFEARGNRGPSLLFETSRNNAFLINAVAQSSAPVIGSSLFYSFYQRLPNDTDFTVFRPHDIPGLNFAFGENLDAYHSRLDTVDNLSESSLQHHGAYAVALTRQFGQMDLTGLKDNTRDDIFFNWFGSHMITYGDWCALPGEFLAGMLLAIVLRVRRPEVKRARRWLALLLSLVLLLAIPLAMAAVGGLVLFIVAGHTSLGDSTAKAFLLWGCVGFGSFVGSLLLATFRKRFTLQEFSRAGLSLAWLLSLALAWALPAGSYLLFWPVFLTVLGLLVITLVKRENDPGSRALATFIGMAATVLIFVPVIHLLYVFLTLQLISIIAAGLLLGLFFLICAPWLDMAAPRYKLILLLVAVITLGIGIARSHSSSQHPRRDTILYSVNADDRSAAWLSYDHAPDAWTSQFFPDKTLQRKPAPNYLGGSQDPVLFAPAALAPQELPGPVAEMTKDETKDGIRNIHLSLKSPRGAQAILISFDKGAGAVSVKAGGRNLTPKRGTEFSTIRLLAPDPQGIELELGLRGSSPFSLWLMDVSSGLPGQVSPRPGGLMASQGSDFTLVGRKYSF